MFFYLFVCFSCSGGDGTLSSGLSSDELDKVINK